MIERVKNLANDLVWNTVGTGCDNCTCDSCCNESWLEIVDFASVVIILVKI